MEFVFWDSTLTAKIFLGEQFCCIYHSQRHNWPHILENITRKFPKSRNIQNFQNRQSGMLSIVSVVCLTNQSSSTKSERNMVIKRSKNSDIIGHPYFHWNFLQVVLSSAFSPTHWLLATGCLSGRLAWHQPVIWSALTPVLLFVLWDSCFRLHV